MMSLIGAAVVVSMFFFNNVEISSGMNQGGNKPETLQLFNEKPELLGRKYADNSATDMRMKDQRNFQLSNEGSKRIVDDGSFRKVKPKFEGRLQDVPRLNALPNNPSSLRLNTKGTKKNVDNNAVRSVAKPEQYKHHPNRNLANKQVHHGVERNHGNFDNHHLHSNRQETEYDDTASSTFRTGALASYDSFKVQHGLRPQLPRSAGYHTNLPNQNENRLPHVDTPHLRQTAGVFKSPYTFDQGQYEQYPQTQRPGQFGQFPG